MQVAVVDLDTMQEVRRIETDPGAIVHFGNAFEEGDEIVVDAMYSDQFDANEALSDIFNATPQGRRVAALPLNAGHRRPVVRDVSPTNSEFPTFNQLTAASATS